jgi:hypothetical protein
MLASRAWRPPRLIWPLLPVSTVLLVAGAFMLAWHA